MLDTVQTHLPAVNAGRLAIGAEIRCAETAPFDVAQWTSVLGWLNAMAAPEPLVQYYVARENGVTRMRPFGGPATLLRALHRSNVIRIGLDVAGAHSSIPVECVPNYAGASVTFAEGNCGPYPWSIHIERFIPLREQHFWNFLVSLQRLFEDCDYATGHLHISTSTVYARNETTDTHAYQFNPTVPAEATHDRVERLARFRNAHDMRVFGAYWGTLLNAAQVQALGGVRHVQAMAPVARTDVLDGGAMYLQLTAHPEPITTPAMRAALPLLEAYLAPISVPVPYFRERQDHG